MRNTVLAVAAASLVAMLSSCVPPPRQRARAPLSHPATNSPASAIRR